MELWSRAQQIVAQCEPCHSLGKIIGGNVLRGMNDMGR